MKTLIRIFVAMILLAVAVSAQANDPDWRIKGLAEERRLSIVLADTTFGYNPKDSWHDRLTALDTLSLWRIARSPEIISDLEEIVRKEDDPRVKAVAEDLHWKALWEIPASAVVVCLFVAALVVVLISKPKQRQTTLRSF